MIPIKAENHLYQACYCEENIWHLCQHQAFSNSYVVFIASLGDYFPMLYQAKTGPASEPVYWDYHVVLLLNGPTNTVFDFDTQLGFGTDMEAYFKASFIPEEYLTKATRALFKLVPAKTYIESFCSDRSHMQTQSGWSAPPPQWPAIGSGANNLAQFRNMQNDDLSEVFTFDAMLQRFAVSKTSPTP